MWEWVYKNSTVLIKSYDCLSQPTNSPNYLQISYLFSHQKYEAQHILETWSLALICFSAQNMKPTLYMYMTFGQW